MIKVAGVSSHFFYLKSQKNKDLVMLINRYFSFPNKSLQPSPKPCVLFIETHYNLRFYKNMKRIFYSLALLFVLSISVALAQETTRNFDNFTKLDVSGVADITLKQGNSSSAKIKLKGNINPEELITKVKGNTLYISLKKKHRGYRNIDVDIELTFKQLEAVELSGAVSIRSETPVKTNKFYLGTSGAGSIHLNLDAQRVACRLSGASSVKLQGQTNRLKIDLSGAGSVKAYDLVANVVESESSGAGSIRVNAQKELYAKVSGVGNIRYKGNPAVTKLSKSGFGSIRKAK